MITTRFAPSPTGNLHIGGARTALFNWLFARHHKGHFILRIEDTDRERSKDEYTRDILGGLAWLGMEYDRDLCFQSARMEIYRDYAYKLLAEGKAYRCYCPPELVDEKRKRALAEGRKPSYDRTCRDLEGEAEGRPFVIRFKAPLSGTVTFQDIIRGAISFQCEELDDLVIYRTDESPTYNFTVVIDDALMGITHIIRGDDHINNTPRQVLLYEALGFETPFFAHVPLIHGKDKARLSKRHGATSLLEYRESGLLAEAMMNYLARLGWGYGDQEVFSRDELIEKFDLANVGKSPAVFDMDKLLWLNSQYMKILPVDEIARRLVPFLENLGCRTRDEGHLIAVAGSLRERAKTLQEMAEMARFYFDEEIVYEAKSREKYLTPATRPLLAAFLDRFVLLTGLSEEEQKPLLEAVAQEHGTKVVDVAQPVRVALTGRHVGPGIYEIIRILGKEVVESRITKAILAIE